MGYGRCDACGLRGHIDDLEDPTKHPCTDKVKKGSPVRDVGQDPNNPGMVTTSPNGKRWRVSVDDNGVASAPIEMP